MRSFPTDQDTADWRRPLVLRKVDQATSGTDSSGREFLRFQCLATARVALSSQSRFSERAVTSTVQKNLCPLIAGLPKGLSNPALRITDISWGKKPSTSAA